jgi:hypothetical protein
MIRAELADGRILEFPDGTDPEAIQRAVKSMVTREAQEIPDALGPMVSQIVGTTGESIPRGPIENPSEDEMWKEFRSTKRAVDPDFENKQVDEVRYYMDPREETAGYSPTNEMEKLVENISRVMGEDFDQDFLIGDPKSERMGSSAIFSLGPTDYGLIKLASGRENPRSAQVLIPSPSMGLYTPQSWKDEGHDGTGAYNTKEMIEVHLNELPSILDGSDDRFTPEQVEKLQQRIGPLIYDTMERGKISTDLNLGTTRMFKGGAIDNPSPPIMQSVPSSNANTL